MKPLEELSNVQKGKLLFELFPSMIPALLAFAKSVAAIMQEQPEEEARRWQEELMTSEFWQSMATAIETAITKYDTRLTKSSRLFAVQLFDGYNAVFMQHVLYLFTEVRKSENEKFALAVKMLFNT
jgi:hypothetical protein